MKRNGFTLVELLMATAIMTVVVVGALALYSRSNKISADQQQFLDLQNDVRAATYIIARELRMTGAGIPANFVGFVMEGFDNESGSGGVTPDRLRIMGNLDDPLVLPITNYSGSSANVTVADNSFENAGYPDAFFDNRMCLVFPKPSSPCIGCATRLISHVTHNADGTNEKFNFSPGQAPGVNPPGGLSDVCADSEYFIGGFIMFGNVNEYWLDVTGSASGMTGGSNGYLGVPGVLYATRNGVHYPLAQNIENLQFQFNGDLDFNGRQDGFTNWNTSWSRSQVAAIRQVRMIIVGRTPDFFVSVNRVAVSGLNLYRRPPAANNAGATSDDWHKRFVLETTSTLRNAGLNIYNLGMR